MATFFKYAIGVLVLGGFTAILVNSIRSFITVIRERVNNKKSPDKISEETSAEDPNGPGKGGANS